MPSELPLSTHEPHRKSTERQDPPRPCEHLTPNQLWLWRCHLPRFRLFRSLPAATWQWPCGCASQGRPRHRGTFDSRRPQVRESRDQRAVASSGPRCRPHIDAKVGPGYTHEVVGSGCREVDKDGGDKGRELRQTQRDRAKCWWRVVDPKTCKEGTDIGACCKCVRGRRHDLHQHKSYVVVTRRSIGRMNFVIAPSAAVRVVM